MKTVGLWFLYLASLLMSIMLYLQVTGYFSRDATWYRDEIRRMQSADVQADVEAAVAAGEFRLIGYSGFTTLLPGIFCQGMEIGPGVLKTVVGSGDVVTNRNREYGRFSGDYAAAYNRALISHPDASYRNKCLLKNEVCDWDDSEGGVRGCEAEYVPVNAAGQS
jgi:hypothetical protein